MADDDEIAAGNEAKWNRRAASYNHSFFDAMRFMQRRTVRQALARPTAVFLDVGCGTGYAVDYAAGLLGPGAICRGVDLSPGMIEMARSIVPAGRGSFAVANAERLPFDDVSFDCIVCTNSFHHYPHADRALAEFARTLSAGGRLYITDVTADGLVARSLDAWFRAREKEHVRFRSSAEMRALFEAAGLRYEGADSIVLPLMKIHRGVKA